MVIDEINFIYISMYYGTTRLLMIATCTLLYRMRLWNLERFHSFCHFFQSLCFY